MLNNPPDPAVFAAFEIEYAKGKQRLDSVWAEKESLERSVLIIKNDIETSTKHLDYLNGLNKDKQAEIDLKQKTISGLDTQIADKEKMRDELHEDIQGLLEDKDIYITTLREIESEIENHRAMISGQAEASKKMVAEADEKNRQAEDRIRKIIDFINQIK